MGNEKILIKHLNENGIVELISVFLNIYPMTYQLGLLLINAYLGGAMATELAAGWQPVTAILLTLIWISVYFRNKEMFIDKSTGYTNL